MLHMSTTHRDMGKPKQAEAMQSNVNVQQWVGSSCSKPSPSAAKI